MKQHGLRISDQIEAEFAHDSEAVWSPDGQTPYVAVVNKDEVVVAMFLDRTSAAAYLRLLENS